MVADFGPILISWNRKAKELIFTSRILTAQQAFEYGESLIGLYDHLADSVTIRNRECSSGGRSKCERESSFIGEGDAAEW